MTHLSSPADTLRHHARHALVGSSNWIVLLARLGYAAKAVVYGLVGMLAVLAAFGRGGQVEGSKSALATLLDEPGGKALLVVIAIGLTGYALWCFVQAAVDPERDGSDATGIGKRTFNAFKGVLHLALVVAVVQMIIGSGGGSTGEDGTQHWTARVMAWPAGRWIVTVGGVAVAIYGLRQMYRGWTADLDDQLDLSEMTHPAHRWTVRACRFGMAARGAVFVIIGSFLAIAGLRHDPQQSKGFGEAMRYLQEQPYGPWLLAIVAAGLIAYGLYELVRARYRRIEPV